MIDKERYRRVKWGFEEYKRNDYDNNHEYADVVMDELGLFQGHYYRYNGSKLTMFGVVYNDHFIGKVTHCEGKPFYTYFSHIRIGREINYEEYRKELYLIRVGKIMMEEHVKEVFSFCLHEFQPGKIDNKGNALW